MNPGDLDTLIEIQSLTTIRDSFGGVVETWATIDTVWAQIKDLEGREYFLAQQARSEVTVKIVIRWRDNLLPQATRIKEGSRVYDILSVAERGRRDRLEIMAKRRIE